MRFFSVWLFVFLSLCAFNVLGSVCEQDTDLSVVPCVVVTPCLSCESYNYSIIELSSGVPVVFQENLSLVSSCFYTFNFSETGVGDYGLVLCNNQSTVLTVSDRTVLSVVETPFEKNTCGWSDNQKWFIGGVVLVSLLFFVLSFVIFNPFFASLGLVGDVALLIVAFSLWTCLWWVGVMMVVIGFVLVIMGLVRLSASLM